MPFQTPLPSLLLLLLLLPPLCNSATTRSDIIGEYILSPETTLLAVPTLCPLNLTFSTFQFAISTTPRRIKHPDSLNIEIPHDVTTISGRRCDSSGAIEALESAHPFAQDVDGIMQSWGKAQWTSDEFMGEVAKQSWNIAYDFLPRTCRDKSLPSFVAYLWFQPGWDLIVGKGFHLKGGTKYLLLNFIGKPKLGCVYVASRVGGPDNPGPVSDPSLDGQPPADAPPPQQVGEDGRPIGTEEVPVSAEDDAPVTTPEDPPEEERPPSDAEDAEDDADEEFADDPGSGSAFNPDNQINQETGEDPACFPAQASVQLADGAHLRMRDLRLGHAVRVGKAIHSDIFFFSHRAMHDDETLYPYIELKTSSGNVLTLSSGHYLHVNNELVAAQSVRIGDELTLASGECSQVVALSHVMRAGKFAPHTLHGDIIVDGVLVSTYTTAVHPRLAHHVLLAPLRFLYRVGLDRLYDGMLDGGKNFLRMAMPKGPQRLRTTA